MSQTEETPMASPARPTQHHIALTVTDLDASIDWYSKVFGITLQMEGPHEGGYMKLLADEAFQFVIVLHRHDANENELFVESRTGLDHLGMGVVTRADLEAWQ